MACNVVILMVYVVFTDRSPFAPETALIVRKKFVSIFEAESALCCELLPSAGFQTTELSVCIHRHRSL
jgi:hypothetical protein